MTTFHTLRAALASPGLRPGDEVLIEPRSSPGAVRNADLPDVPNLTVRGNPLVGPAETPAVVALDNLVVSPARDGLTLRDLSLTLTGGPLTFRAGGTLFESQVVGAFDGPGLAGGRGVVEIVDTGRVVLDRNTITGTGDTLAVVLVEASPNTANAVRNNRLVANAPGIDYQRVVQYREFSGPPSRVFDEVAGNTLVTLTGADFGPMLDVYGPVSGLTIRDNTFRDPVRQNQVGVQIADVGDVGSADRELTVRRNTFDGVGQGVVVSAAASGTGYTTTAVIDRNVFDSRTALSPTDRLGWGWGLRVFTRAGSPVRVTAEGNDFQSNRIGVEVSGTGSAADVDLGGGPRGSRGGNNFRNYPAPSDGNPAAIATAGSAVGPVSARSNLFGVADPERVIYDRNDQPAAADVVATSPLTGNAAYVQTLYLWLLGRLGDLSNPTDAGYWVGVLNGGTPADAVVRAIFGSQEGTEGQVRALYRKYLSRDADAGGLAFFTGQVRAGTSYEQVALALITSAEYRGRGAGGDGAFVQSLLVNVLGRRGSPADLDWWAGPLAAGGRAGVAGQFLGSAEYRAIVVRGYFGQVLRRPGSPTAAEVNYWVAGPGSPADILVVFLASAEYQRAG